MRCAPNVEKHVSELCTTVILCSLVYYLWISRIHCEVNQYPIVAGHHDVKQPPPDGTCGAVAGLQVPHNTQITQHKLRP